MVDLTPQIANFYIRQAQSQASANDYSRLACFFLHVNLIKYLEASLFTIFLGGASARINHQNQFSYGNQVTYIDRVRLNHQTLKTL